MATNPTDDEIDTEIDRIEQRLHDEFLVSPEIYVRLEALIKSKAHTDAIAEQERRYKIHEKYHELNDKDIEIKAHSEGYKEGQKDTANQIFAELDKKEAWIFDTVYYPMQKVLVITEKQLKALKKEYKVD